MNPAPSHKLQANRRWCGVKTAAIVPSAGYGKRLGLKVKKPFALLGGRPLVSYALAALDESEAIDAIIIAAEKSCVDKFRRLIKRFGFKKIIGIVIGGRTRFESVRNCLDKVGSSYDIVLVHDGARPFVEKGMIDRSIRLAEKFGGCVVGMPESDTVKLVGRRLFIKKTLDRTALFRAATPQAFRRDLLVMAYAAKRPGHATDDARLVEEMGGRVKMLRGSYRNIKITTREDLKMAEALLS